MLHTEQLALSLGVRPSPWGTLVLVVVTARCWRPDAGGAAGVVGVGEGASQSWGRFREGAFVSCWRRM